MIKERIAKLIDVKSIVTILLTLVVIQQTIIGRFDVKDIYLMIVAFYFGTQHQKAEVTSIEKK